MNLYVVRPKAQLVWPTALFPRSASSTHTEAGWQHYLKRHPEMHLRGLAGYVVDLDAPMEQEFCAGQHHFLMPISEMRGRNRPRKATVIELDNALSAIEGYRAEEAVEEPSNDSKGSDDEQRGSAPDAQPAPEGAVPEVEGAYYRPITDGGEQWAGVYQDAGTDEVTHLLGKEEDAEPLMLSLIPMIQRPRSLHPVERTPEPEPEGVTETVTETEEPTA